MEAGEALRRDNYSSKCSKRIAMELARKKKIVRTITHLTTVNIWDWFLSQDFDRIACFKQNLNAELMRDIDKHGTAWKQFGLDSTIWQLNEDNYPKYTWKVALNWKARPRIKRN